MSEGRIRPGRSATRCSRAAPRPRSPRSPACWRRAAELAPDRGRAAAGARRAGGGRRLRHVLVHRAVVRGRARGGRPGRDRRVRRLRDAAGPTLRPRAGAVPVRDDDRDPAAAGAAASVGPDRADHRRPGDAGGDRRRRRHRARLRRRASRSCRPGSPRPSWRCCWRTSGEDIAPMAAAADRVLAAELPAELLGARQFTFLGTGWTCGLASEAALKLREAAGPVDGGVPGYGVPARADRRDRAGQRRLAAQPGARRPDRRGRGGRRPGLAVAGERRSPSSSGCTASRPRSRGPAGLTRTGRGT